MFWDRFKKCFTWLVDLVIEMVIDQGEPSSGPSKWSPEVTVVLLNIVQDSVFKNIIPDVQM